MGARLFCSAAVAVMFLISLGAVSYAQDDKVALGKAVVSMDARLAAAQDHDKGEHWAFYVNFDKKKPFGSYGCYVHQPQGAGGELLHCKITAPPEAKGYITRIEYSCESGPPRADSPCNWVHECPSSGLCQDHNYAYEPHDLNLLKVREVNWFGWTNDGNPAILRFDVFMREREDQKAK